MADLICLIGLWVGVFFVFVASLGLLRMPDLYTRAHASGKAGTLGKIGAFVAVAAAFPAEPAVIVKCLLVVLFLFLTAPIGIHLLLRAAHRLSEAEIVFGTEMDEYEQHKGRSRAAPPDT